MNKEEFIYELEKRLREMPAEERKGVLNYYKEYVEEITCNNNGEMIESPEEVANTVLEEYSRSLERLVETITYTKDEIHEDTKAEHKM